MRKDLKLICCIFDLFAIVLLLSGCFNKNNVSNAPVLGKWENGVYTNKTIDLEVKKPKNWSKYSEETLYSNMGINTDKYKDEKSRKEQLEKLDTLTYLIVSEPNTGNNIAVHSNKIKNENIDSYLNNFRNSFVSSDSIKYEVGESKKEKISGTEYNTIIIKEKIDSINIVRKYFIKEYEDKFVTITISSLTGEDEINKLSKYIIK